MACNFMGDEWFVDSLNQKVRQGSRLWGGMGRLCLECGSGQTERTNLGEFRAPEILLAAVSRDEGAAAGC